MYFYDRLWEQYNWITIIVMAPTLLLLVALEVVVMTTSSAASDNKVGIITAHGFLCINWKYIDMFL